MLTFATSLDQDQARQNVGPDLDPICLALKEIYENVDFEKKSADDKQHENFPAVHILLEICQNLSKYEPRHKISNNVVCATSKGSDQPAHMRSLIRVLASR